MTDVRKSITTSAAPTAGRKMRVETSHFTGGAFLDVVAKVTHTDGFVHFTKDETRDLIAMLTEILDGPAPTPSVGAATINITADTTGFDEAIKRIEADLARIEKRLSKKSKKAKKVAAKIVALEAPATPAPRFKVGDLARLTGVGGWTPGVVVIESVDADRPVYGARRLTRNGRKSAVNNALRVKEAYLFPVAALATAPSVGDDLVVVKGHFDRLSVGDVHAVTSVGTLRGPWVRIKGERSGYSLDHFTAA